MQTLALGLKHSSRGEEHDFENGCVFGLRTFVEGCWWGLGEYLVVGIYGVSLRLVMSEFISAVHSSHSSDWVGLQPTTKRRLVALVLLEVA